MDQEWNDAVKTLVLISQGVGSRPDLVQGGGGNTSVKWGPSSMVIKASGFELAAVTLSEGYTAVDYGRILSGYHQTGWNDPLPNLYQQCVLDLEGRGGLRPSIETGFHSLLGRVVIHTHSVYANLLTCSQEGKQLLGTIFPDREKDLLWVPFVRPGFELTKAVFEGVEGHQALFGTTPTTVFLENHGLVVHGEDAEACLALHEEINARIQRHFSLGPYPDVVLRPHSGGTYQGASSFVHDFLLSHGSDEWRQILFPDQIVYFRNDFFYGEGVSDKKIVIRPNTAEVVYQTVFQEAKAIEETFVSFAYLLVTLKQLGLRPRFVPERFVAEISEMEEEKYRKKLMASQRVTP